MDKRNLFTVPLAAFICGIMFGACAWNLAGPQSLPEAAAAMSMSSHGSSQLRAAMDRMMNSSSKAVLNGDTDHDFLALMISHHEGAIEMAAIELRQGKRPEVRRLARGIVAAQTSEIKQMRAWLRSPPGR